MGAQRKRREYGLPPSRARSVRPADPDVPAAELGGLTIGKVIGFEADVKDVWLPVEQSYVSQAEVPGAGCERPN